MAIHVLVACSKSKNIEPSSELVWGPKTNLKSWNKAWEESNVPRFVATDLYSGRATLQQLEIAISHPDTIPYLISAGAGLIRVSDGIKIPPYEATFRNTRGPSFNDWHRLPERGLSNIVLEPDDMVVAFAPPAYLRALSKDPVLESISHCLVTPLSSSLSDYCRFPVMIHPRVKEVLGVGSADLNTALIRLYLQDGLSPIERINDQAENLPRSPVRRKVSDDELMQLVLEHHSGKTQLELVRFFRDNLLVSASVERISGARRHLTENI